MPPMRYATLAALLLAACSSSSAPQAAPAFQLLDVNTTSTTYDTMVSPRDYVGTVTAWYFASVT